MNIVYICNEYPPLPHGGIGTFVHTAAHEMSKRGHNVTVVGMGSGRAELSDGNVRVVRLPVSPLPYVGNLVSRLRLRRWLERRAATTGIDILETPDHSGFLPFRIPGVCSVVRLHQTATAIARHRGAKRPRGIYQYEYWTLRNSDGWIGVSEHILEFTQKLFRLTPRSSSVIYNPVVTETSETAELPPLPREFVLFASQICRRKGAVILAEAMRGILSQNLELHLVYAGGFPQEDGKSVRDQILGAMGHSNAERVHFLGQLEHAAVLGCMRRARVFVFPSQIEALGLAVLEAMGQGAPVVCGNIPAAREIIDDGVHGLLADPLSAADFQEKIELLRRNRELASRISAHAVETVRARFSVEICFDATEKFYFELLSARHGRLVEGHAAELNRASE